MAGRSSGSADFTVAWDDGAHAIGLGATGRSSSPRREGLAGAEALGVYTLGGAHWLLLGESDAAEECLARSLELFRGSCAPSAVPSPLNIAELRWPGLAGSIGPRVLFEDTLQPFQRAHGGTAVGARPREPGGGRARARRPRAGARALRRGRADRRDEDARGLAGVLVRRAYLELAEGDLERGARGARAGARAAAAR